ncbi:uncharacterized protein [Anabrus simplex]|uniref:uncharacterized protein n=1 Tax=Anabrus simplex TaxID=316456 RepID=UPI0035A2F79B
MTLQVLASICLGLLMDAMMNGALPQKPTIGISCIVSGAYIIINVVLILTYALGQQLPCCVSTLFSAIGGLLYLMSGRAMISSWDDSVLYETELYALIAKRQVKIVGHLSFLAGLMYLMDACFTTLWESEEFEDFKNCRDGQPVRVVYEYEDPRSKEPLFRPVRIIELILVACCLFLLIYFDDKTEGMCPKFFCLPLYVVFSSVLLIVLVDIVSQLAGDPISKVPMFLFSFLASAAFFTAAGVAFSRYSSAIIASDILLALGIAASLTAITFLLNSSLMFRSSFM